jgi:hypothetical protein
VIAIRTRSHSLTNGRVKATKRYTARMIDWLAVWEPSLDRCFYIPAAELGAGMDLLHLRLVPALNNQMRRIRPADQYTVI